MEQRQELLKIATALNKRKQKDKNIYQSGNAIEDYMYGVLKKSILSYLQKIIKKTPQLFNEKGDLSPNFEELILEHKFTMFVSKDIKHDEFKSILNKTTIRFFKEYYGVLGLNIPQADIHKNNLNIMPVVHNNNYQGDLIEIWLALRKKISYNCTLIISHNLVSLEKAATAIHDKQEIDKMIQSKSISLEKPKQIL